MPLCLHIHTAVYSLVENTFLFGRNHIAIDFALIWLIASIQYLRKQTSNAEGKENAEKYLQAVMVFCSFL